MKKRERGREKKCTSKKATSSVVKTTTATYRGAEAYIGSVLLVVAFCIPYNAALSASKGCVFSTLASLSQGWLSLQSIFVNTSRERLRMAFTTRFLGTFV